MLADETQKHLTFRVDPLNDMDASIIRRIYGRSLVEWDEKICKLFLEKIGLFPVEENKPRKKGPSKQPVFSGQEEPESFSGEVHK